MALRIIVILLIAFVHSVSARANEKVISFAVGHDHEKMLSANYPIYRANWEFITDSLSLMDYQAVAVILPWVRAKHLTQTGKTNGLFLAANLEGRDKWAELSHPLGYGIFGGFYHIENPKHKNIVATIRLGAYDKILSQYHPDDMLEVTTAHQGFKLLFNRKVDRLIMSESYGKYLLDTELDQYKNMIRFDESMVERRTVHIAFAKNNFKSQEALRVVNQAIKLGYEKGLYQPAMIRNNVPKRMFYFPQQH